jgi:hypothetical protein
MHLSSLIPMSPRTELLDTTEARLLTLPEQARGPEALLDVLVLFGDALRLGLEIPRRVRDRVANAPIPLVRESLALALSLENTNEPRDAQALEAAVQTRDSWESVRKALKRMSLPGIWDLSGVPEAAVLEIATARLDTEVRAHLSRTEVVRFLGPRARLGEDWTTDFTERSPAMRAIDDPVSEPLTTDDEVAVAALAGETIPDDAVVTAYLYKGALARYVEGVANRNPLFFRELRIIAEASARDALLHPRALAFLDVAPAPASTSETAPRPPPPPHRGRSARPWLIALCAFAALLVLAGLAKVAIHRTPAERAQIETRDAELRLLEDQLRAQGEAIERAQREAKEAKTDAERAEAARKLAAVTREQRATSAALAGLNAATRAPAPATSRPRPPCTCKPADPLCSCL